MHCTTQCTATNRLRNSAGQKEPPSSTSKSTGYFSLNNHLNSLRVRSQTPNNHTQVITKSGSQQITTNPEEAADVATENRREIDAEARFKMPTECRQTPKTDRRIDRLSTHTDRDLKGMPTHADYRRSIQNLPIHTN